MSIDLKYFRIAIGCLILMLMPVLSAAQAGKPPEPVVVAKFQGTVITQEELDKYAAQDLQKLQLERTQFEMKYARDKDQILQNNLTKLLEDKLLTAEAARRGITKDQLLDAELKGKYKDPTEDEVKAFYEANKQRINQPLPQISSQLMSYLSAQNYNNARTAFIDRLKQSYGVTVAFQPQRSNVEVEGYPAEGPADAPVTLVEFADFQCPYCASLDSTLRQVLTKYAAQVRLVYRNFPLVQIHQNAEKAAEAGLCAADQGHFWEMHDLMFQSQSQLKDIDLKAKAAQLKLDVEAFNSCLDSGQKADKVKQDLYAGASLGVTGTPVLFINGRFVSGAVPFADIARIIEEELKSSAQTARRTSLPGK